MSDPELLEAIAFDEVEPTEIKVVASFVHHCPFVDEEDKGTITIIYRVYEEILELHSLRRYLDNWEEVRISHEEITHRIKQDIEAAISPATLSVTTYFVTAGMDVTTTA